MLRNTFFAAVIAFGAAGAAQAQQGPVLIGSGDDYRIEYGGAPPGSFVGSASVTMQGAGENQTYAYGPVVAVPGREAALVGSGADHQLVYREGAPATGFAGTTAADSRG